MPKVRYVNFYADEWLAGTAALDALDVAVYIQACALIYSHGGAVEREELKRIVRCHWRAFDAAFERLVKLGKLTLDGTLVTSKKCSSELQDAVTKLSSAVQNGSKGGRPPKKINGVEKPGGFYARAKGNQDKEDSSNLKEEELGRDAPSVEAAPVNPPPDTPKPAQQWSEMSPEDRERCDALVRATVAKLTDKTPSIAGIYDQQAYEAATKRAIRDNWLAGLHSFICERFDGDHRTEAWEAVHTALEAGSRAATPPHVTRLLDDIDKLRHAEMRAAA